MRGTDQNFGVIEIENDEMQEDKFTPGAWVNAAISAAVNAPDDDTFKKCVRRLHNVISPSQRKKYNQFFEEDKAELEKLKESVPDEYRDYPDRWRQYALAEYSFEKLVKAIYRSMGTDEPGVVA